MARHLFIVSGLLLLNSCAIPRMVDRLHDTSPPPEFGRPWIVRFLAGTGAWVGGIAGGVVSVALLPVTYPISLIAGDQLGEGGREEFLLAPAIGGAATGHFLLGAPVDVLDYVVRRAWFEEEGPENPYDLVPMMPPLSPPPPDAATPPTPDPGVKTKPDPETGERIPEAPPREPK